MFCGRFYWQSMIFRVLCPKPWSTEEFVRKCKLFVFNISTDNSIVESLAWIVFPEICLDKSWKLTEIFYFYQIDMGIKIFNNKNCKVTFGFEYTMNPLGTSSSDRPSYWVGTAVRLYSYEEKYSGFHIADFTRPSKWNICVKQTFYTDRVNNSTANYNRRNWTHHERKSTISIHMFSYRNQ